MNSPHNDSLNGDDEIMNDVQTELSQPGANEDPINSSSPTCTDDIIGADTISRDSSNAEMNEENTSQNLDVHSDQESDVSLGVEEDDDDTTKGIVESREPLSSITCPICLDDYQVFYADHVSSAINNTPDIEAPTEEGLASVEGTPFMKNDELQLDVNSRNIDCQPLYQNQHGIPVFQLSSCKHQFCAPCLYAFIKSKLIEGTLKIPCCYFNMPTDDSQEFNVCNTDITEKDILQLIDMEPSIGASNCWGGICTARSSCNGSKTSLKEKYEKIKFDEFHGKDSVRRCPKCDEPQLYDVLRMKSFSTSHGQAGPALVSVERTHYTNNSDGSRTRIGRMFGLIRRSSFSGESSSQRSTVDARDITTTQGIQDVPKSNSPVEESVDIEEATQSNAPTLFVSTVPVVNCQRCNTEFCYFHSNAHTGQTCIQYNEKTAELDRVNVEYANQSLHSKQCPRCGILVTKEGGCNQIRCGSCGTHFCWLCRTEVDDGAFPEHFRWWNLNGCPNMQLDSSNEPSKCTVCTAKLLSIAQLIVLGIPSLVLAIASSILCPCLIPGVGRDNRERAVNCISFWGSCLSTMLMFPFSFIGMVLLTLMYCFVGMLFLLLKCCTLIKHRVGRQTARSGEASADANPAANDPGSTPENNEVLIDLERIFEMIEAEGDSV